MSRLSRGKKREHERAARPAAPVATPVAVHVPADGSGASVGGVPVRPTPGEEIQQAVLGHLHRIALASGHPVLATVTDERIGYVVPLQVHTDGSSTFAAEPLRTAPPDPPADAPRPGPAPRPEDDRVTHVLGPAPDPAPEPDTEPPSPPPAPHGEPRVGGGTPYGESAPTFPMQAVPESLAPSAEAVPTFVLRALPEAAGDTPFGTAVAPTGVFGPPPVMDASPADVNAWPEPAAPAERSLTPGDHAPASATTAHQHQHQHPDPDPDPAAPGLDESEPKPTPTPARGFDAVAEAVLGEDPRTAAGEAGAVLLAEPLARVNEAVKEGRIEEAAALAERTVADASGVLGPEHPEVLRARELTAYIAYLAGDPLRSFGVSLGLARIRRRAGDAAAAYGDVQSAATAWRAVRDPEQGLRLGRDLIDLWAELIAEDGPAADDIEQLESARARMGRLAERAREATPPPPS
ncbi:tetratricopeptide repeat protein [Streptomyces sp. CoT10]|uniref:tetratricopeptide repeat protein n=1 Tax=Streptomyces sp. CoT10 TaxID=2875762 RepID=UPI001CD1FAF7|nr:tetratricopeptide repeat protein [Streptomyces sp. CoT10]